MGEIISIFNENLHYVFQNSTATNYPDENATIYSIDGYPREVNIFATNNTHRVTMAIKHRSNELKLNKYPLLASAAIALKRLGEGTESAWVKVLQLTGNPYDVMTRDDIEDIAIIREKEMEHTINNLLQG